MGFNRRRLKYALIVFVLFFKFYVSIAQQEAVTKQTLEDIVETIAGNTDVEMDYTSLYEDLNFFLNEPLHLNTAQKEDLEKLQFLNDFQISSLLNYLQKEGPMLSVYELQLVFGFSMDDVMHLLPFITITDQTMEKTFKIKNALKYGTNQLFIRGQKVLEKQLGYSSISDSSLLENPNSRYLGSPYKVYAKYKYNYKNKVCWGITGEKDPGEEFFTGTNKNGFDYYSAHLQINDLGIIKTISLGDYQAKFGQGLLVWSDMGLGKSPDVLNTRKRSQGLKKYASTNENRFMRGAGTTLSFKKLDVSAFYSKKNIDANIQDSIDKKIASVSSFQNSGYHTIPSEITDKDAIGEQILGGNISYNHSRFKLGITGLWYAYEVDLIKDLTAQNQFDFQGKQNSNLGLDYHFAFRDFIFFGEEAISSNGGKAFLNAMLVSLAPQVSLSVIHRYYEKNYQTNFGNAFAESSSSSNESGIYFGLELHPIKNWTMTAYFDTYKFPWIKTGVDAPSNGYECFFQTNYNPAKNLSMYFRIKLEEKQVNQTSSSGLDKLGNQTNFKFRFHISTRLNEQLSLKNRIETSRFNEGSVHSDYGFMFYQDLFYDFRKAPLSFNLRFAIFDTDSYASRIYAYESDILYAFSIPAYYSQGTRTYINLKYTISEIMDIWLRYAQSYYSDLEVISSGLNQITGNTKSEVKAQLRIKF